MERHYGAKNTITMERALLLTGPKKARVRKKMLEGLYKTAGRLYKRR